MDRLTFTAWDISLKKIGYRLAQTGRYGTRLYVADGKPAHRIGHCEPNLATAAWMKRQGVIGYVADPEGLPLPAMGDLPEFGLEGCDDYHTDIEAQTRSMLSVFMDSPVDYYEMFITGLRPRKPPTPKMKIGTICHAVLLEKKRIDEACVPYPGSCFTSGEKPRLRSKEAKKFEEDIFPRIAVKEDFIPIIEQTIRNARASKFGALLELHSDKAKFEFTVEAEIEGVRCKCKPDIHIILNDQIIVPDLKFGVVKPDEFWLNAKRLRYWLQQAHYTKILRKSYGLPVEWRFWAFETVHPYRVQPYWYNDRSIQIAESKHSEILRRLKKCQDTGEWKDNFNGEGQINPWDVTNDGEKESSEEVTEVDENFDDTDYESDPMEL